jgi:nucleotidyltransferase/DNA polymerase involved in DNA repair
MSQASADIMRVLKQLCPGCLMEKASIDEAYVDITPMVVS